MPVEIAEYTDIVRPRHHSVGRRLTRGTPQKWSHGLYVWRGPMFYRFNSDDPTNPQPQLTRCSTKPTAFQLDFHFESRSKSLGEIVDRYVALIEANPNVYPAGKYNVRVLVDFEMTSVTLKVT